MQFKKVPVYNAALESEGRTINLEHIEQVLPHANVPVNPGAVDNPSCEVKFYSGTSIIVLVDQPTFEQHLGAITGEIDTYGTLA
jgi:hypothetical protein